MLRRHWALVLVLVTTAAVYAPWLDHEFIWDDFVQISENPAVRDGVPLARYFVDRETTSTRTDYNTRIYRPLRNVAFRVLWSISELAPKRRTTFFHGANLLLYLLGGLLVRGLCRRITGDPWAASLAACAWLLLPVHAEDVLYASAFGDLLSFAFQLLGLIWLVDAIDGERPAWRPIAALLAFTIAVFVKEAAITSILIVPLFVATERRAAIARGAPRRSVIIGLVIAHVFVGLAYLALRTKILGRVGQEDVTTYESLRAVFHAPWLLLSYLKSALLPLGHAPDYDYVLPKAPIAAIALCVGGAMFLWTHLRPSRGVRFGAWFYVLALAPVLHFVPLWTLMADRFLLVPTVGLAVLFAGIVARAQPTARLPWAGMIALLGLLWTAGAVLETRHFEDDETLFAYGVREVPRSQLSNHNYGLTLLKHGDFQSAIFYLNRAAELGRRDARLYYHLGVALESAGRDQEATSAIDVALKLNDRQVAAYVIRARLLRHARRYPEAAHALQTARAIGGEPNMIDREAATLATESGRIEDAITIFLRLTEKAPRDHRLWLHLAECQAHVGKVAEARAAAARCISLAPSEPRCPALLARLPAVAPAP